MSIRIVRGGSTGERFHVGPGLFKSGYRTTANGRAEDISCGPGEVIAKVCAGSPYHFATWVAGPYAEVIAELRRRELHGLAERVAAATLPEHTPAALLATALGNASAQKVAEAAAIARVKLSFH